MLFSRFSENLEYFSGKIWNTDFVGKREMISLKQISYSMQCWNPSLSISFMQTTDISFISTRALECKLHENKYLSKLDWKMKRWCHMALVTMVLE